MKKRLTALLLSAVLLGSSFPVMPAAAAEAPAYTAEAVALNGTLNEFLTRIADWESCSTEDCVLLRYNNHLRFLTPTLCYNVNKGISDNECRVYTESGSAPTPDAVRSAIRNALEGTHHAENLSEILDSLTITETDGCFLISTADVSFDFTLSDVLKKLPDVRRIEVPYLYIVDDRILNYNHLQFVVQCDQEPDAADFPALSIAEIKPGTKGVWLITLDTDDYADYFKAAKLLSESDTVQLLWLNGWENGFAKESPANERQSAAYQWEATYSDGSSDALRTEFLTRIAGWDNAALEDCVIIEGTGNLSTTLYTPHKKYSVSRYRCTPYRVYLDEGTTIDTDTLLEKWNNLLRENGYPADSLKYSTICTLTEADGGYDIKVWQDSWGEYSIIDCLKTFPNVRQVDAGYTFHTSDRPNIMSAHELIFTSDKPITAEEITSVTGAVLSAVTPDGGTEDGKLHLTIPNGTYEDYFAALKYLNTLDDVHDLTMNVMETALGDVSADASLAEKERTVLYERSAAEIPVLPVFGDHTGDDPLYSSYLYGEPLLNGTKKLPENGSYYFTGQIFLPGDAAPVKLLEEQNLTKMYCDWAPGGYYIWREDNPLTMQEAQQLCTDIMTYFKNTPELEAFTPKYAPSPVYCTKLPCTVKGDVDYDNTITISDAKKLLDGVVYASVFTDAEQNMLRHQYPTADVNGDGEIDISDVKAVLDYSVYTLTFGKAPEWKTITGK